MRGCKRLGVDRPGGVCRSLSGALLVAGVLAVVVMLMLKGSPGPVWAQDDVQEQFQKKLNRVQQDAAKEHYKLGSTFERYKMYELSWNEYKRTVELDPDHRKARKKLGYKKDGDAWVIDPRRHDRVKKENEANFERKQQALKLYREKRTKMGEKVAKKYYELAEWASEQGLESELEKLYLAVLRYDADHEASRHALGFEKVGERWMSGPERQLRDRVAQWLQTERPFEKSEETTQLEADIGSKLIKLQNERFRVLSVKDEAFAMTYARLAETVRDLMRERFQIPDATRLVAERIDVLVLETKEQHKNYAKNCSGRNQDGIYRLIDAVADERFRPPLVEAYSDEEKEEVQKRELDDHIIHTLSHLYLGYYLGDAGSAPWLMEGIAYYFSDLIARTAVTY